MILKNWQKETENEKIKIEIYETDSYEKSWGVPPFDTRLEVINTKNDKYLQTECRVYKSRNAAMNQARKWLKMYDF